MRRAERVVTLPPTVRGAAAVAFARDVARRGADLLEVRTDLHGDEDVDLRALAAVLPLIASQRGRPLGARWRAAARWVDVELGSEVPDGVAGLIVSHHAAHPLEPSDAASRWNMGTVPDLRVKHVEPLGAPSDASRLLETRERLARHFGSDRVTVLATGPLALPFRAVLASHNDLDYLAASPEWLAAPGQRLLDDARRADAAPNDPHSARLGILGTGIAHSWSPRIHPQPFDRIDLPPDAPIAGLLRALHPHYRGFAVTHPFKQAAARAVGADLDAVNTLLRDGPGWRSANTDVEGAAAVLAALSASEVTVLGGGGTAFAVRLAAERIGIALRIRRSAEAAGTLTGACVWTWPPTFSVPRGLRFEGARVAVIAYGAAGRAIRREIESRGGTALPLGPRWFTAQARAQRALWPAR